MKPLAFAVLLLVGCTPDVDPYPVVPASNAPTIAQVQEPPSPTAPDAGVVLDGGVLFDAGTGGEGFDALPTAFDAGMPYDVGSPPPDAL